MSDTEILAEVALYAKTGRIPACLGEWADLTFRLLEQRDTLADKLGITPDSLIDRGGFDMRNFGFSDLDEETDPAVAAEDKMMQILSDNPEIADSFPDCVGFAKTKSETAFGRDFFEKNPDVAFKMSVGGKNADEIRRDFEAAYDSLAFARA